MLSNMTAESIKSQYNKCDSTLNSIEEAASHLQSILNLGSDSGLFAEESLRIAEICESLKIIAVAIKKERDRFAPAMELIRSIDNCSVYGMSDNGVLKLAIQAMEENSNIDVKTIVGMLEKAIRNIKSRDQHQNKVNSK